MKNKVVSVPAGFLAGAFVLYNIILFVIAGLGGHGASFWISYLFIVLAFALTALFTLKVFYDKEPFRYLFLGFPMLRWSVIYLAFSIALGTLFMLVDTIQLAVITQVLLIGAYCAIGVFCYHAKAQVIAVDEKKEKVQLIRLIYADVDAMSKTTTDREIKEALIKLAETIRYSDPNSDASLIGVENEIRNKVDIMRGFIRSDMKADSLKLIGEINRLVVERNASCKALKR